MGMLLRAMALLTSGNFPFKNGRSLIHRSLRQLVLCCHQAEFMPIRRYRIQSPTIALFVEEGRHVAHTVPAGAIVAIDSEAYSDNKLVDVVWEEKTVMMFAQDVRSRGEKIEETETAESG
jgi:hypothetical protein